jgi:hypothetical protein
VSTIINQNINPDGDAEGLDPRSMSSHDVENALLQAEHDPTVQRAILLDERIPYDLRHDGMMDYLSHKNMPADRESGTAAMQAFVKGDCTTGFAKFSGKHIHNMPTGKTKHTKKKREGHWWERLHKDDAPVYTEAHRRAMRDAGDAARKEVMATAREEMQDLGLPPALLSKKCEELGDKAKEEAEHATLAALMAEIKAKEDARRRWCMLRWIVMPAMRWVVTQRLKYSRLHTKLIKEAIMSGIVFNKVESDDSDSESELSIDDERGGDVKAGGEVEGGGASASGEDDEDGTKKGHKKKKKVDKSKQGDITMYTIQHLIERSNLKRDRRIQQTVFEMWEVGDMTKVRGELTKEAYIHFICMLHKALIPNITRAEADEAALHDWETDSEGRSAMSYAQFHSAMFELADMWCESIDADEYAQFLRQLAETMTEDEPEAPHGPPPILSPRQRKELAKSTGSEGGQDTKLERGAKLASKYDRAGGSNGSSSGSIDASAVLSLGAKTGAKLATTGSAKHATKHPADRPRVLNRKSSWKSFETIESPLAQTATNPDPHQGGTRGKNLGRRGSKIEEGAVNFVENIGLARRRSSTKSPLIRQQSERYRFDKESSGGFKSSLANKRQPRRRSFLSSESTVLDAPPENSPSRPAGVRPSVASPRAPRRFAGGMSSLLS